ncbi:DUF1573 domain-containing protein [bacterium]|nr:DUF1573 domain-containing protein [bacterium]
MEIREIREIMSKHPPSKIIILTLTCMGLLCGLFSISWAAPRIKFDQTQFDCGEVIQGKEAVHVFEFHNEGDENLIINNVKAG